MIFRKIAEELDVGFGSIRRDELVDTVRKSSSCDCWGLIVAYLHL